MFSCIGRQGQATKRAEKNPTLQPRKRKASHESDPVVTRLVRYNHGSTPSLNLLDKSRTFSTEKVPWFLWSFRRKKKLSITEEGVKSENRSNETKHDTATECVGEKSLTGKGEIISWSQDEIPSFVSERPSECKLENTSSRISPIGAKIEHSDSVIEFDFKHACPELSGPIADSEQRTNSNTANSLPCDIVHTTVTSCSVQPMDEGRDVVQEPELVSPSVAPSGTECEKSYLKTDSLCEFEDSLSCDQFIALKAAVGQKGLKESPSPLENQKLEFKPESENLIDLKNSESPENSNKVSELNQNGEVESETNSRDLLERSQSFSKKALGKNDCSGTAPELPLTKELAGESLQFLNSDQFPDNVEELAPTSRKHDACCQTDFEKFAILQDDDEVATVDTVNNLKLLPNKSSAEMPNGMRFSSLISHFYANQSLELELLETTIFANRKALSTKTNMSTKANKLNVYYPVGLQRGYIEEEMNLVESFGLFVPSLIDFYESTFRSNSPSPVQKALANSPATLPQWKQTNQQQCAVNLDVARAEKFAAHRTRQLQTSNKGLMAFAVLIGHSQKQVDDLKEELKTLAIQQTNFNRLKREKDELLKAIGSLKDDLDNGRLEYTRTVAELQEHKAETQRICESHNQSLKRILEDSNQETSRRLEEQASHLHEFYRKEINSNYAQAVANERAACEDEIRRATQELKDDIRRLRKENISLSERVLEKDDAIRDLRNQLILPLEARIQAQMEKYNAEIASLGTVVTMRNEEVKKGRTAVRELERQSEELLVLRDKLQKSELCIEDLNERLKIEREEKRRCEQANDNLCNQIKSESQKLKRLSMDKEQLEYKLNSYSGVDLSQCNSPVLLRSAGINFTFTGATPPIHNSTPGVSSPRPPLISSAERRSLSPVPQSPGVMRRVIAKSESLSYVLGFDDGEDLEVTCDVRNPKTSV